MREGTAPLVRREDYAPPPYWIRKVDLTFDLDPAKTMVTSRMQIERNGGAAPGALRLHGRDITLTRCLANGEPVSFRHEEGLLVIDNLPEGSFTLEIRNTCAPEKNTQLSGLYTSGGGFFTQCEAEGFRRITYFLDRPDVMAEYSVLLRANKAAYPVLLSNGNLVEQGELDNGRHFARWHDPFPKPSYLFALVAADLVAREQRVRSRAGNDHLLQIHVRRGDLDKTEHALASLIAAVVWDEARFGLELDLDRFMIVAVGDYNMGAMENKGLNIFNTRYVLASAATATDADFAAIQSVVGHEYFHNWTGNRITCRDWFQLSLKEGLTVFRDQEFSMDMAATATARAVIRIGAVRNLRTLQFPEDAGPMAHPVRPESYVEINNFYTTTVYEKGAEVVRMMQTLVGRAGFAKGMTLYFDRHDGKAVTCDDFAQAVADANPHSDLARLLPQFKRWYSQAGTPRVTARGRYDAPTRTYTLGLEQAPTSASGAMHEPFVIPLAMGLVGRDGRAIALRLEDEPQAAAAASRVLVLDEPRSFFTFVDVDQPPVLSLLRGFSAPIMLVDGLSDADLLVLLCHDSDPYNRWEAGQRLAIQRLLAVVRGDADAGALDSGFVSAMREVLRHPELDPAFKELVLTLPSESYVAEQLDSVDPQRIHAAREAMKLALARALRADWEWAFETHQVSDGYSPDPVQSGYRALANLSLAMLCLDAADRDDPVWPGRAYQRVKDASNMTLRQGALTALLFSGSELADPALDRFLAISEGDPLVVDKWFTLQAMAPESGGKVFERVRALLHHPEFSIANPNRARSLIGSFCLGNPGGFHRVDAAGYAFWADRILEIDPLNPQLASRIARALDRWTQLAEPYRSAARAAIARVAASARLSTDTTEIVSRALAAG
ncbi:MAG TPA: aminopeptidase N [Caldimonas sp.]|jgi:aminopeptidase N|nr:aminopeptidase N [Caldimonas sp.]HEX4234355.1 aminopeptidase N [Caldimonas sp.]